MGRPKGSVNKEKEIIKTEELTGATVKSEDVKTETVLDNYLFIENLPEITVKVKALMEEKKLNPSVVHEEDAGTVFLDGGACMVIDNEYIPIKDAQKILQTRKVVREYIKLQNLINNKEIL